MFKRGLVIVVACVLLFAFAAQVTLAQEPPGAKLYKTFCAACHGNGGKGGFARDIGDQAYLDSHFDSTITQITRNGVAGKGMPAWSKANGGTLTDEQIDNIVAYLRSLSGSAAPVAIPTPVPIPLSAADYVQTRMTIEQSASPNGALVVNATLKDLNGQPVVGASIAFLHSGTFGKIDLGSAKTDGAGKASLALMNIPETARQIDASFKGDQSFGSSEGRIVVHPQRIASSRTGEIDLNQVRVAIGDTPLLAPEGSLITPNSPLVPTLLFGLVVLGVWSVYGFVIYQVVGIWKGGRIQKRENVLTPKAR